MNKKPLSSFAFMHLGPERGQQAAGRRFSAASGSWILRPHPLARVLCTFVPDTRREAREALLFVHFPTMKRDRHIEERRAKWERETVPKGTLSPMNLATVRPGRGRDVPGSNGGRAVRVAERLQRLPGLLIAAAPSSLLQGAEESAPSTPREGLEDASRSLGGRGGPPWRPLSRRGGVRGPR